MDRIYTIVLNYNNYEDTLSCVNSLIENTQDLLGHSIVIVDNASTDDSYKMLNDAFNGRCTILLAEKNEGYAAGNNIGIKYALNHKADYICILNNDTVISMDYLTPCIKYLKDNQSAAFVGPVIEDYFTGKIQSTGGRVIIKKGAVVPLNMNSLKSEISSDVLCDYLCGACLVISTKVLKMIGLFPECYFLFFEETEWCYKAKQNGYYNICLSDVYIRHKGSATVNRMSGLQSYLMERNRVVFLKRNVKSRVVFLGAIFYLVCKYCIFGLFIERDYFKNIIYMRDGLKNEVDLKRFPFITINYNDNTI